MKIKIETDTRLVDYKKYVAMAIPCHCMKFLVVEKPKVGKECGKCPICGCDIYVESSGWCGHF